MVFSILGIIAVLVLAYWLYHGGRMWAWRKRAKLYGDFLRGTDGLQTFCSLRGAGTYTLVIVTASGSSALEWEVLTDTLARTFRVLRYDRYENLVAKGVLPGPDRWREPDPFPGALGFVPDP